MQYEQRSVRVGIRGLRIPVSAQRICYTVDANSRKRDTAICASQGLALLFNPVRRARIYTRTSGMAVRVSRRSQQFATYCLSYAKIPFNEDPSITFLAVMTTVF